MPTSASTASAVFAGRRAWAEGGGRRHLPSAAVAGDYIQTNARSAAAAAAAAAATAAAAAAPAAPAATLGSGRWEVARGGPEKGGHDGGAAALGRKEGPAKSLDGAGGPSGEGVAGAAEEDKLRLRPEPPPRRCRAFRRGLAVGNEEGGRRRQARGLVGGWNAGTWPFAAATTTTCPGGFHHERLPRSAGHHRRRGSTPRRIHRGASTEAHSPRRAV